MLDTIKKPATRPPVCTFIGEAGMGKTSLAATFPNPIFIRAEDGLQSISEDYRPDAFPVLENVEELWAQLNALIREDHEYKTLVVDSVTKLEMMFMDWVVKNDPKKPTSINQAMGGYGSGMKAVAAMHSRLRKACAILNKNKDMAVVFLAHASLETIELPDSDKYQRYTLRLAQGSQAPYVDDVDLVGFLKLETLFRNGDGDKKKAITDGTRVLLCHSAANCVSKNRYGIEEELTVAKNQNPLKPFIKGI